MIAVLSVVYPGIDTYFLQFLNTLSKQTAKNFTLFLINDGLSNINDFLKRIDFDVKIKDVEGKTPAALRKMGIKWAMAEGMQVIIFADADDYFAKNRVELSKNILNKHNLVFNELILKGQELPNPKPMLGALFNEGEVVGYTRIRTANFMGLSNTAIRVKNIPPFFDQIPNHLIAFDWAFFALCLHGGTKGVFTERTATYYRQHENNLANPCSLTETQIMRGVQVKSDHYRFLSRFYPEYLSPAGYFGEMQDKLQADEILRRKYCEAVKKQVSAMPLWWEPIKTLEAVGL